MEYIYMNEYRFYHCYQKQFSTVCYPVENANILPSEPNTRLLFVSRYLPEMLDIFVLKYKYYNGIQLIKKE